MRDKTNLTANYAALQCMFWMTFSVAVNYAAVYLQGFGYTNTAIGIIVAIGNILGVIMGPQAVTLSETKAKPSPLVYSMIAIQGIMLLTMRIINRQCLILSICFTAFLAFCLTTNSMALSLYTTCTRRGITVDYAFARGIGSAGFVIISASLGVVAEKTSPTIIPVIGLGLVIVQLIINRVFIAKMENLGAFETSSDNSEEEVKGNNSIIAFASRNKRYTLMILFSVFVFIGHNSVYNFYINVVRNVGGNASAMGFITAYMGLVEVPVMLLYGRFSKGKDSFLLRFAFIFFVVKALGFALAGSIPQLYVAQTIQLFSYAIYASAIVPYSAKVLPAQDAAKGQSLAYSMTVVGSVLSSVIAGPLYDNVSVSTVLWVCVAFCAVGAAGCFVCIDGKK